MERSKRSRKVLVSIKSIPGLFLMKRVRQRRKPSSAVADENREIEDMDQKIDNENAENIEEKVSNKKNRISPKKAKITLSLWSKEWLDQKRYQKNSGSEKQAETDEEEKMSQLNGIKSNNGTDQERQFRFAHK
jgi:hypothetical protein